jgi:hypothetical protein
MPEAEDPIKVMGKVFENTERDRLAWRARAWAAEERAERLREELAALRRTLRPLSEDDPLWHSACDWGHCSGIATWERYEPQFDNWLPVCGRCAHLPDGCANAPHIGTPSGPPEAGDIGSQSEPAE